MDSFFVTLLTVQSYLLSLLQQFETKTDYTEEEQKEFESATNCYLCQDVFNKEEPNLIPVRDHCHYSNRFLGACHQICNIQRRVRKRVPVFIHNFSGYDSHFIIKGLSLVSKKNLSGLPLNMEKFRTLTISCMSFIDSIELMPGSLGDLVNNLSKSDHDFSFLEKFRFCQSKEHKELLLRKGVYPYEWSESVAKLKETKKLPAKEDFFSSLTQKHISDEDYAHAQKVFSFFNCKNMLDYCELYCCLDTVLLLEVLWSFRKTILSAFGLDCTRYISIPQLSFDCMLTTLDKPLSLLSDPAMVELCEKNIRGGVSFINERHVQLSDFSLDGEKKQEHLLYVDANNLYSVAQLSYLPTGDYEWCSQNVLDQLSENMHTIPRDSDIGYILEVDLEYPEELHETHKSLPLAPEQMDIVFDDLSPFAKSSLKHLRGELSAKRYKSSKLCSTLKNKNKYVVHYTTLNTYVRLGMKLKKIHRAMRFTQAPALAKYIKLCTEKRKLALTPIEKQIWKLTCNAVYGKLIQNNRKHMTLKFTTTPKMFTKHYASPFYRGHRILSEKVTAIYLDKKVVKLDRLYAMGFSVLDLSKEHMFSSYYDFFQPALGIGNVEIVLSDTDSFVLHIKHLGRDEVFERIGAIMDYSNYPSSHPLFSNSRKAIPGYFKDENCGNIMTEIVGLRSKCYTTQVLNLNDKTLTKSVVCKGVGKAARNSLTLEAYRSCINSFNEVRVDMHCIRSKSHNLYTQKIRKIALSSSDDKRYLLDCGRHTRPYGFIPLNFTCADC